MKKYLFALAVVFSLLLSHSAFCADKKDQDKEEGKKTTTALDGRVMQPLKKDDSDEFPWGDTTKRRGSKVQGGKGEAQQREEGDERGRVEQDKEPSRSLHKKEDEDEVEQRSRIYHFVEHMKNPNLTIPEALQYIQAYFINLEEGTEQGQYENLVSTYTRYQQQTRHGNPSAITILSLKNYPVSTAAVRRIGDDASAPPSEHSEQTLLQGLSKAAQHNKVALYTNNSPCMLMLSQSPCIVEIGSLSRGKNIRDMMVQYDVFYEYKDYKKYQKQWEEVFLPVKISIIGHITSKLAQAKEFYETLDFILKQKLKNPHLLQAIKRIQVEVNGFKTNLERDIQSCRKSETFSKLPKPFAGHVFQQIHGRKNTLSLLWSRDKDVIETKREKFSKFPPSFLEDARYIQGSISEIEHSIKQKDLERITVFLGEMNHIY